MTGTEIERLILQLAKLPGLGPRSARRAAFSLARRARSSMSPAEGRVISTSSGMSRVSFSFFRHFLRSISALDSSRSVEKRSRASVARVRSEP